MTVITILCKLSFHYFINTTHPLTHTPSHLHTLTHHTGQKKKLSMIFGVTIPCCLSIFSVILFLRLGFVLGQVSPSLPHHLLSLNLLSLERSENETNPPLHIFPHSWPYTHTHIHTLTFLPPHTHTYTPSHFSHHTHTPHLPSSGWLLADSCDDCGWLQCGCPHCSLHLSHSNQRYRGRGRSLLYPYKVKSCDHEYSRWELASFLLWRRQSYFFIAWELPASSPGEGWKLFLCNWELSASSHGGGWKLFPRSMRVFNLVSRRRLEAVPVQLRAFNLVSRRRLEALFPEKVSLHGSFRCMFVFGACFLHLVV